MTGIDKTQPQSKKLYFIGLTILFTWPIWGLFLVVLIHDYYPQSDLASLGSEEKVKELLEHELPIGQATTDDTVAVLRKHHVENCEANLSYSITCQFRIRSPILTTGNGSLLLTEEEYYLEFDFAGGKLATITVRYITTAP